MGGGGTNGAGTVFEITGSGFGLLAPPPANPAMPAGTSADMILRHSSGQYAIYDLRNNVILRADVAFCRSIVDPGRALYGLSERRGAPGH
jgi:hypothetical protein